MDASAYLQRIGISETPRVSRSFLDTLIYAHQCAIPFEDIDVYDLGLCPSLDIDTLFEKVINRKRGGYCFELNALFCALLNELGFEAYGCFGRVVDNGILCDINHRANMVKLEDNLFLVDVGLGGPMPPFAVSLLEHKQCKHGETYWTEPADGDWFWLKRLKGKSILEDGDPTREELSVLMFSTQPQEDTAFMVLNWENAGAPDAPFKQERLVNLRTPQGYLAITNDTFIESCEGVKRTEPVGTRLWDLLQRYFGITICGPE